jgi:plasmid stability protein
MNDMSRALQVRNVPDDLRCALKARAAVRWLSLSDYLLEVLGRIAARPTRTELYDRLRHRSTVDLAIPVADIIAAERHTPPERRR